MQIKDSYSFKSALFISLLYCMVGIFWIYFSDSVVEIISIDHHQVALLQTYKGFFYIFITTIFLYILFLYFLRLQQKEYIKRLEILEKQRDLAKSLEVSNEMYRALFDNMLDSATHCRMIYENGKPIDLEYLNVNHIFESMTGFHAASGHRISEFIPNYAEENPESLLVFDEVASSQKARKWEHYLKAIDKWFNFSLFSPAQGELIIIAADVTEAKKYEQHIFEAKEHFDYMAHHDPLTALPNRTSLLEKLELKTSGMEAHPFALLFLDLDAFKEVNDSYGHRFGDELLIRITHLLQILFPKDTFISRTGGDEFVILLSCQKDKNVIHATISSLIEILNNPLHIEEIDLFITASIGIAMYPSDAKSAEELLQKADAAMYNAKNLGRNTYSFYDVQFTQKVLYRTTLATQLKKAMQNNELELYFQPQIDVKTEKLLGLEALLRWPTSEVTISPAVFIPIAEESGLILQLGEYVLVRGCQIAAQWAKDGLLNGRVAINVSARQLTHIDFLMTLDRIIKETECSPLFIEIEITESSIIGNPEKMIALLKVIKAKGFHISIDDFGTGYSSLSYLKNLPIDKLKIDISFIRNITQEPKNQTIVKTIIALAKGLNMSVLAEGVESSEELEFLRQNGIDSIQGYYYHKPMPLKEINHLLSCKKVKRKFVVHKKDDKNSELSDMTNSFWKL